MDASVRTGIGDKRRLIGFIAAIIVTGFGGSSVLSFGAIAEHSLKAARRSGEALSAIIFDIDEFKKVNDELGHPAGDAVLARVASRALEAIRESDLLCRWGGEEFLVLLRDCAGADALAITEKLRASIEEGTAALSPMKVTVSAGIAELGPEESFDSLVDRADRALLEAKRAGRNRAALA